MHLVKTQKNNSIVFYSNTYNIFSRFKKKYPNMRNEDLNKFSAYVYQNYKRIHVGISEANFIEELVIYEDFLISFVSNDTYRIFTNCLYLPNELKNPEFFASQTHLDSIHSISNNVVGTIGKFTIINTYESYLNFAAHNNLPKNEKTNIPFLDTFNKSLCSTKISDYKKDSLLGLKSELNDGSFIHTFNFVMLDKISIITNYIKTPISNSNTLIHIPTKWRESA